MQRAKLLFFTFLLTLSLLGEEREETLCGTFFEPFVFWLWNSMTPEPMSGITESTPFIKRSEFQTSDDKILRGYEYLSNDGYARTVPKGYILVAMGNTMVSDRMILMLKSFSFKRYDVYVYDYRGYAESEGKRRIKAIIEDYKEIATSLNKRYERRLLYGISLGGAVMLNVISSDIQYDAAVIDSAPSFLSPFGCPESIDPLNKVPKDASRIFIITAQRDSVLPSSMTSPLREYAKKRGAKTLDAQNYDHPFADKNTTLHQRRLDTILEFFDTKK